MLEREGLDFGVQLESQDLPGVVDDEASELECLLLALEFKRKLFVVHEQEVKTALQHLTHLISEYKIIRVWRGGAGTCLRMKVEEASSSENFSSSIGSSSLSLSILRCVSQAQIKAEYPEGVNKSGEG